jgi:hypothetical protein
VLVPDNMATRLGIAPEEVDAAPVQIQINGLPFRVAAIFTADSLQSLTDVDGAGLLPFDIEKMAELVQTPRGIVAETTDPHIPASEVIIAPLRDLGLGLEYSSAKRSREIIASAAVSMPATGYRQAQKEIIKFMEQTGQPVHYGLDGIAYKGRRTREFTLRGILDLVLPLLIAALTVLNAMRGSVYERRDEIYVYNALGIAPRYVFFMFFAEACVYAVVGCVLGYVLSQGVGRGLAAMGLGEGMNMTYASLATIYASLTIFGATLLSSYYPARQAMAVAAPAEEAGWSLPEPQGDELAFDVPFTFAGHERIGIIAFFHRYLVDHGEGSAGRFFAGPPSVGLAGGALGPTEAARVVPRLETTIWLKPFDLAVSQQVWIALPFDPETSQYKAHITIRRLSGTLESWLRLNRSFVRLFREHFLHWRAVPADDREELYREARGLIEAQLPPPQADNGPVPGLPLPAG